MSEPWGHKITVHIYLPGGIEDALDASDLIANADIQEHDARITFMGITIDPVQDEPQDQVAP